MTTGLIDREEAMDLVWGIVQAALMAAFIGVAITLLAGLFMIVFGIAAGIGQRSGNS